MVAVVVVVVVLSMTTVLLNMDPVRLQEHEIVVLLGTVTAVASRIPLREVPEVAENQVQHAQDASKAVATAHHRGAVEVTPLRGNRTNGGAAARAS